MWVTLKNNECEFESEDFYGQCEWTFVHELDDEFNIDIQRIDAFNYDDFRIELDENQLWELREAIIEEASNLMLWENYLEEQREWNDYLNDECNRYEKE